MASPSGIASCMYTVSTGFVRLPASLRGEMTCLEEDRMLDEQRRFQLMFAQEAQAAKRAARRAKKAAEEEEPREAKLPKLSKSQSEGSLRGVRKSEGSLKGRASRVKAPAAKLNSSASDRRRRMDDGRAAEFYVRRGLGDHRVGLEPSAEPSKYHTQGDTAWREGDKRPWAAKGAPAVVPPELQLPADQQSGWRLGDEQAFRLNGAPAEREQQKWVDERGELVGYARVSDYHTLGDAAWRAGDMQGVDPRPRMRVSMDQQSGWRAGDEQAFRLGGEPAERPLQKCVDDRGELVGYRTVPPPRRTKGWRAGDTQPIDPRPRPRGSMDQQSGWRAGDEAPFRVDGREAERTPREDAARRFAADLAPSCGGREDPQSFESVLRWQREHLSMRNLPAESRHGHGHGVAGSAGNSGGNDAAECGAGESSASPQPRHKRTDVYPLYLHQPASAAATMPSMQSCAQQEHVSTTFGGSLGRLQARYRTDISKDRPLGQSSPMPGVAMPLVMPVSASMGQLTRLSAPFGPRSVVSSVTHGRRATDIHKGREPSGSILG